MLVRADVVVDVGKGFLPCVDKYLELLFSFVGECVDGGTVGLLGFDESFLFHAVDLRVDSAVADFNVEGSKVFDDVVTGEFAAFGEFDEEAKGGEALLKLLF
jgi:hypothetical protein